MGAAPHYYDGLNTVKEGLEWNFSAELELEAGYLWGEKLFIGPEVACTLGYPYLAGADIRMKIAAPFTSKDALTISFGLGMNWGMSEYENSVIQKKVSPDKKVSERRVSDSVIDFLYLPVKAGYEHVFDNGFVIGASFEWRMRFKEKLTKYYYRDVSGDAVIIGENGIAVSYIGYLAGGIHLGYKF